MIKEDYVKQNKLMERVVAKYSSQKEKELKLTTATDAHSQHINFLMFWN